MTFGSIYVTGPDGLEHEIPFSGRPLRIGSAPGNDLVIGGPGIGAQHATLSCNAEGQLLVEIAGEPVAEQSGMRLTIDLSQIAQRRELAWIGEYVLSYQPTSWDSPTQPLQRLDLPADAHDSAPSAHNSADETALLQALLSRDLAQPATHQPHEAVTVSMPLIALAALGTDDTLTQ